MKKAFTLIELLVVVLIIGVLAAIALPQYEKAVWKSRLAEVMTNTKAIQDCFDMYVLQNGLPPEDKGYVGLRNLGCAAELTGGVWNGTDGYSTDNFSYYDIWCNDMHCQFFVAPKGQRNFVLKVMSHSTTDYKRCYTNAKSLGRMACKIFESMGYSYIDEEE